MQYRKDKYGNDLSTLGFGCMRFQTKMGKIDFSEAEKDFRFLNDELNGTKYILKGNHDYWWETLSKLNKFLNYAKG